MPGGRARTATSPADRGWGKRFARAGVREYWMIDPDRDIVSVCQFMADETEIEKLTKGQGANLASPLLPGWSMGVDELLA